MKWKRKNTRSYRKHLYEQKRTRIIKKFLFFPKCINDEWRWLVSTHIVQDIIQVDVGGTMEWGNYDYKWHDLLWAE